MSEFHLKINKEEFKKRLDIKDGKTPIAGIDFPFPKDGITPVKGRDYFDGERGDKGDSIKGDKGDKGDPGEDATIESLDISKLINIITPKIDYTRLANIPQFKPSGIAGTGYLREISDVQISNLTNNQVLTYNSTTKTWRNTTIAAGISIGGAISGGTDKSILFIHPDGTLAEDNANFNYDPISKIFTLGGYARIVDPSNLGSGLQFSFNNANAYINTVGDNYNITVDAGGQTIFLNPGGGYIHTGDNFIVSTPGNLGYGLQIGFSSGGGVISSYGDIFPIVFSSANIGINTGDLSLTPPPHTFTVRGEIGTYDSTADAYPYLQVNDGDWGFYNQDTSLGGIIAGRAYFPATGDGAILTVVGYSGGTADFINFQSGATNIFKLSPSAMTLKDGLTVSVGTTTGVIWGGASDKQGWFGATPVQRQSSTTDMRTALINLGLYGSGGASPLNLNGGIFTTTGAVNGGALAITGQNSGVIQAVIKGAGSQAVDLTQWQNSSNTVLASVDLSGNSVFANGAFGTTISSSTFLNLGASTTAKSSVRIPHGSAPTSPVNGDMWTTTAGAFIRINGVTKTFTLT